MMYFDLAVIVAFLIIIAMVVTNRWKNTKWALVASLAFITLGASMAFYDNYIKIAG